MMNRKTLGLLAGVLVVLIVLSWATSQRRYSTTEGGGFVAVVPGLDAGEIAGIRAWLGDADSSAVELQRSGDGWVVASRWGWPAKDDLVSRLLDDLGDLEGERRSSSGDVLEEYDIAGEKALHVVLTGSGGGELARLVVGKTALRGGCFVRRDGSDEVYLTPAALRSSFGVWGDEPRPPDAKRWIELRVHRAERNDVDRVTLRDGDATIVLAKEFAPPAEEGGEVDRTTWTWAPDDAGAFAKNEADGVVSSLCNLYATDVVEPGDLERYGLAEPARTATIEFADGTTTVVAFGSAAGEDGKMVHVRVGDGDPATIHSSTVDRIFPSRSELMPAEG